jgi:hypothetical protein
VLRDAQSHTRRNGDAIVNDLVAAAAPAVIAALAEADPGARDKVVAAVQVFAPGTKEMVEPLAKGLGHADPSVRVGAGHGARRARVLRAGRRARPARGSRRSGRGRGARPPRRRSSASSPSSTRRTSRRIAEAVGLRGLAL